MDELTATVNRLDNGGYKAAILHRRMFKGEACEYRQQISSTFATEEDAIIAAQSVILRLMGSACHERRLFHRFS